MTAGRPMRAGFTLVEVVVVLAVIGILVALLLPAVQDVRRAAARADCLNRVRQVALGLHAYHDAHGRLPGPVAEYHDPTVFTRPGTGQDVCWPAKLLPHVGEDALAAATRAALAETPNVFRSPPHVGLGSAVRLYTCPADHRLPGPVSEPDGKTVGITSYLGVIGTGRGAYVIGGRVVTAPGDQRGMFGSPGGTRLADATDGLSQTLLIGERPPDPGFESGWWYVPNGRATLPSQPVLGVTAAGVGGYTCRPNGAEPDGPGGAVVGLMVYGPGRFDNPCDALHFWSAHPGGANWAMADGSARFVPYSARPVMRALASGSGGEIVIP
ncbi:MAG: DUF1559 domain-containing protein [Gemmataceae bacterium]|nr:DUF1559 domain-containing protein [Gemmataceae bacterium]